MIVLSFSDILKLNIEAEKFYKWSLESWELKPDCILPPKIRMWQGESGRYITMPCVIPSCDVAGVKFISRNVDSLLEPPARNSNIFLQRISASGPFAFVDGVYITNMRTAANAVWAVKNIARANFASLGLMGLGIAARSFFWMYCELYKDPVTVKLLRYKNQAEEFIHRFKTYKNVDFIICDSLEEICSSDVVVSCVSNVSGTFCEDNVFVDGCTIIPVQTKGFQNCDLFFDKVIVDDVNHVKSYKYYSEFKEKISTITDIVLMRTLGRDNERQKILVYSGGIAIHDIYIAHKIVEQFGSNGTQIDMLYPEERLWI